MKSALVRPATALLSINVAWMALVAPAPAADRVCAVERDSARSPVGARQRGKAPAEPPLSAESPRTLASPGEPAALDERNLPSPADGNNAHSVQVDDAGGSLEATILLRAARNSVALGDLSEALSRFARFLKLVPDDWQARYEYAGLLLQAGRVPQGRHELERVVANCPAMPEYRLALADVLMRQKEYAAVREQLHDILSDRRYGTRAKIAFARSLVLEHRPAEARRFFDEHLHDLTSIAAADKPDLAELLIDMDRPADAVQMLAPLHAAQPANLSISAAMVLGLVRMNARLDALTFIADMDRRTGEQLTGADLGILLELAGRLYDEQSYPEARAMYDVVVRRQPEQQAAVLGSARTCLRLYDVDAARSTLDQYAGNRDDRMFTTVLIDYHSIVGEYVEAIALARERLQADPNDLEALLLLANAYHAAGQFGMADRAYAAARTHRAAGASERDREIGRLQARNYLVANRLNEAAAALGALVEEQPTDVGARLLLMETLCKMHCFDAAAELVNPAGGVQDVRGRLAIDTEWGFVLLKQGRVGEAHDLFQKLATDANNVTPDVAYGLNRSAKLLGQLDGARAAFELGPSPLAPPAIWSVGFAGRAMSFCDCRTAAAALDGALRSSPENLVILNMRGEAAQQCTCDCESPEGDAAWFCKVRQSSPTNIRARWGCARSYNEHLEYRKAYAEYQALLRVMPGDVNLIRETASMVEGWRGFAAARDVYCQGQCALENTHGSIPAASETPPSERQPTSALAEFGTPSDEELLAAEYRAKCLRNWRLRDAVSAYDCLAEMEPANESALFDLGQCYSSLNRTRCAADTYRRLLEIDPCNRDAAIALRRCEWELQPKLLTSFDFEDQRGRQGLANITWYNLSASARRPLGDENEFFELGYRQRALQPTDDSVDFGEIPFARWQRKYAGDSVVFANVAVEQYQYGLDTRPTFNAGLDLLTSSDVDVRFGGFLQNYYVCGEAIRQDIYTTGVQLDALWRAAPLWTLSGYYRVANFSDGNWVNWFNANSAHLIWQGRTQLRGLLDYNFYTFAEQTIFGPIPGSLVGTIHPYWSPRDYSYTSVGLEFKRWLSCDTYKGANEHFWTAYCGGAIDSNGVGYFLATCRLRRDLTPWLTWTVDANLIRSPDQVYDAVGVATYGIIRLR